MNALPDDTLNAFDFGPPPRIVFGVGAIEQLGDLATHLGAKRVLVITDAGIVAAGHAARASGLLAAAGLETKLYDQVVENPTTDDVERAVQTAREFQPDLLVGLGGGSSMDCAKGVNFLLTNGGRMQDYWGVGKAKRPMLPMIAVPTTAGTGSETQSFALISDAKTHVKMACGDKKATCRVALLDPQLTQTQPPRVTALTGIDALSHALETFVTTRRNAISLTFSREAWRRIVSGFPRVLRQPDDLDARAGMQLGATLAGLAIENSMLGAAHALANPLTARFNIPHGEAVGLMLPHVIRFNAAAVNHLYIQLLQLLADNPSHLSGNHTPPVHHADQPPVPDPQSGATGLAEFVASLLTMAGLPRCLSDRGVGPDDLPDLAHEAATQWTAQFNPRPVSKDDLLALYKAAY